MIYKIVDGWKNSIKKIKFFQETLLQSDSRILKIVEGMDLLSEDHEQQLTENVQTKNIFCSIFSGIHSKYRKTQEDVSFIV